MDIELEHEIQRLARINVTVYNFLLLKQREGWDWDDMLVKLVIHMVQQNEEMKEKLIDINLNRTAPLLFIYDKS